MVLLFVSLYQNEGVDRKMAVDRAEAIFSNLDVNNDGDITEQEFVRGCLKVVKADIGMISKVLFDIFKDEEMRRLLYETNSETLLSGFSTPRWKLLRKGYIGIVWLGGREIFFSKQCFVYIPLVSWPSKTFNKLAI